MIGDYTLLCTLNTKEEGTITFKDNAKVKIVGIGNVGNPKNPSIENVLLVDGLKHNLISISQLCDKGYRVIFDKKDYSIVDHNSNALIFTVTTKHNVYEIILSKNSINCDTCLVASNDDSWLWHRRLGHASMSQLSKLSKGDFVINLPKIDFKRDIFCSLAALSSEFKCSRTSCTLRFKFTGRLAIKQSLAVLNPI